VLNSLFPGNTSTHHIHSRVNTASCIVHFLQVDGMDSSEELHLIFHQSVATPISQLTLELGNVSRSKETVFISTSSLAGYPFSS
jgi:hypothetical protein